MIYTFLPKVSFTKALPIPRMDLRIGVNIPNTLNITDEKFPVRSHVGEVAKSPRSEGCWGQAGKCPRSEGLDLRPCGVGIGARHDL